MTPDPDEFLIGAAFAAIIALGALRAHALTRGGAAAAFAVGTLTFACGHLGGTIVLLAFFVPSVLLSRLGRTRKRALVDVGKSGPRDAAQVLANGGVATVCVVAYAYTHDLRWAFAFAGAYAAATADTWATEIGTLARHRPRSIFTLRPVATGMSGGITLPGTLAEIAGAVWIALIAFIPAMQFLARDAPAALDASAYARIVVINVVPPHASTWLGLLAIPLGGIAGATLDSALGGSLQELRRCERCDRTCETDPHVCGTPTRLVRGLRGFSNDVVNLAATLAGAAVAFTLA